jgi:Glycine rich protein/PEP-CTERM motif
MLHLRRRFQPTIMSVVASTAVAWMGSFALASASQAAPVTFDYTGADVSYTINPGTYRITVYGAQGGSVNCAAGCAGGLGAEASAIYKIGQTLDLRIGVGGTAAFLEDGGAGGGGASFVDFVDGDPGFDILLLVGGGGGGGFELSAGGNGKTTQTDPRATGSAPAIGGGGGGGGFAMNGQSSFSGGDGGASLSSGGQGGVQEIQGGFGGGGGGIEAGDDDVVGAGGGGGFNGGDAGYVQIANGVSTVFGAQGGTSYVNSSPDGCGPDNEGPACFIGGLVLAVGNQQGNGSVVIELISGSPVPEPSTWAMMAIGFVGLGFAAIRRGAIRVFY